MAKDHEELEGLKKTTALTILVIAVVALLVVLAYVQQFAKRSGYSISINPSDWAQFGDYIGGTLGALFGFFAFAGVLITIFLQRRQLHLDQSKSHLEEIQRLLASVSLIIDAILNEKIVWSQVNPGTRSLEQSFSSVLSAASALPHWQLDVQQKEVIARQQRVSSEKLAYQLLIEITQLTWCLDEYERHGGSRSVIDFYVRRYAPPISALDTLGFLVEYEKIRAKFKTKEYQESYARNSH